MHIFISLLILAVGSLLVMKTDWFLNNFGKIDWFEDKLGTSGGSRLGYKLIGLILLFLGIIFITGSGESFLGWFLSPLIRTN